MPENARLPRNIQGYFTCRKSTTWDKRLYFPSEGRRAEDFFALKNPTASVGFEPANLGTKGQHGTSRPPKPLTLVLTDLRNIKQFLCLSEKLEGMNPAFLRKVGWVSTKAGLYEFACHRSETHSSNNQQLPPHNCTGHRSAVVWALGQQSLAVLVH